MSSAGGNVRTYSALCSGLVQHEHCNRSYCECECHFEVRMNHDVADFLYECWQSPTIRVLGADAPQGMVPRFTPIWDIAADWCFNNLVTEDSAYPEVTVIDVYANVLRDVLESNFWSRD